MKKIIGLILTMAILLNFHPTEAAKETKIYIQDNQIHYVCPDGTKKIFQEDNLNPETTRIIGDRFILLENEIYHLTIDTHSYSCTWYKLDEIDAKSFEFLNDYYQKDRNKVYKSDYYWGWATPREIKEVDSKTFTALNQYYAIDKNSAYFAQPTNLIKLPNVDLKTFKVSQKDNTYASDRNSIYHMGEISKKNPAIFIKISLQILFLIFLTIIVFYIFNKKKKAVKFKNLTA